jgi:hypothetical protein
MPAAAQRPRVVLPNSQRQQWPWVGTKWFIFRTTTSILNDMRIYLSSPKALWATFSMGFLLLMALVSCKGEPSPFTKKDVGRAQKLFGIPFTTARIDTLTPYLEKNRSGYDSLRKYNLGNDVFPALLFDPVPYGFEYPKAVDTLLEWPIPEKVQLPDSLQKLAFYTIPQLASLIKSRTISCVELTQFYLAD